MSKNSYEGPSVANIDVEYKTKINKLKEKHKDDPEHILNKLELKDIYLLAISLALKNQTKPKKSKKKDWIIRTSYLKEEDLSLLKSLIYDFSKKIELLLPENSDVFYTLCEELANAGMSNALEMLEDSGAVEREVLLLSGKL